MPRNPSSASDPVAQYIAAMRTAHSFSHTAETTFYTPLANFLNTIGAPLKPRVVFVAHPGSRGAGLPDGGLFPVAKRTQTAPLPNQRPERGAVEIKPPGESLATLAQSGQVLRYLREYGLCLITNYHQFQLVCLDRNNRPSVMESYDLTLTADDLWHLPINALIERHKETLPDFLTRVLTRKVPLQKPRDVAELLASYAREARERAAEHPLAAFEGVKSALQDSLGITFKGEKGEHFFRSTLIQTLFYGIFSAWILWRRSSDFAAHQGLFNWRFSADYLRVPVLRALFHAVSERGALNTADLPEVLDHATDALNRVQPDFFTTFREEDAVQYFYEPFLEAFDPQLRKDLGVWYTPREIVRYMVERVDRLLRTELNEPLGLASPNVQVLDPCCGTGAYLVEVLHRIERTLRDQASDDDALVGSDLRTAATTRIFGFEIMPAPFVIAHLQIAQLLEDARSSLAENQRAQIFLTNALTGWVPASHPKTALWPDFEKERDAAEAIKQAETILVILGNPPYNGYAGIAKVDEERDLTTSYRTPLPGLPAPQGQGLNDLYVRFFRIAERRIVGDAHARGNRDGRGIVSFISNNAWLDGLSHVSMRAKFLEQFQSIYIDNLNGDKYRTGKTTPDGKPDPSAFSTPQNREGIQVGTAIATMIRDFASSTAQHSIALRNLWGASKLSQLESEGRGQVAPAYLSISPVSALGSPFADRIHSAAYTTWPRLPELLFAYFPGVQTKRDTLVIDISKKVLSERMQLYLDPKIPDEEVAIQFPIAMANTTQPFIARDVRSELMKRGFRRWQVIRHVYRPFDVRYMYWEPTTGLLGRKGEDYLAAYPAGHQLIAQQKPRGHADPPQVVSEIAGLDLMDRGASSFPCYLVESIMGVNQTHENLTHSARAWLSTHDLKGCAKGTLFNHAVAVMYSPIYRTENAGALLGDWPRIPLPATAELLTQSATLGRRLADLLDPESSINLAAEWSFLARLSIAAEFPEGTPDRDKRNADRLALTAGWGGAGQGATVMPRRGKAVQREWTDTELDRFHTLAESQGLARSTALDLLGLDCVDVYLNDGAYWAAVPINVWNYTLGGYQVLKKWLSYRELPLLGRPLHEDEARYFAQVVRRVAAILLMGPALDASYAAILPTATGLPTN